MKRACFEDGPQTADMQYPLFGLGRRWKAKRRRGRMKRACFEDGPQTADMQYPLFGLGRRWKAKRRRGHPVNEKAAIADGHGPFCGSCFFCGAAWALSLRENGFSPGIRKISSEVQKSSCIVHRCTVYDFIAKKEAGYRRNAGRSRSDDISCRKKDVSCRQPRKARKICYTGSVNL